MEERLSWFRLIFRGQRYHKPYTLVYNIPLLPYVAAKNFVKAVRLIRRFRPQAIVSDFDVNGIYAAQLFRIPVITISNMHLMRYVRPKPSGNDRLMYYLTEKPILDFFNGTDFMLIPSLIKPMEKAKNDYFFYPIVRKIFLEQKPAEGEHIVVYSTSNNLSLIAPFLKKFPKQEFIIYGKNRNAKSQNLVFKKFSAEAFACDLANCKAVITHGGISVLSEAAILKKPIYAFTTKDFYERYYNAWLIQKLGFGEVHEKPTVKSIRDFIGRIPQYKKTMDANPIRADNERMVQTINWLIKENIKD
jgi:uncharacterized protein (TIGR00661 family)